MYGVVGVGTNYQAIATKADCRPIVGPGDLTPFISSTRAHFPLKLAGLCLEHQPGTGEVVWVCSRELWVRLTQAHPAHLLKRRQLGEREVSAPRFDLFFCCQDFST